ncbi:MAG TPA: hypothetical protein VFH44_05355 [Solirubrobacterales bacterium]|nr:hypothetical protein [Solirubrobacterales bacterium]
MDREGNRPRRRPVRSIVALGAALVAAALALPGLAVGHLERPSYWPDPRPDRSVNPAAGGDVPEPRSLRSAVSGKGPGQVHVVCKGRRGKRSLADLGRSMRRGHHRGYRVRPSERKQRLNHHETKRLRRVNGALARECRFHSIQKAIFASGNNDRVVVMPGNYREPHSRRQPTDDPRCDDLVQDNGSGGMAPSYRYQVTCPNDQNLVYIQGRALGDEPPPEPPLAEREGIPDLGPCVRCNLQLEGSGVKPSDVIIDAGRHYTHHSPGARPGQDDGCDSEPECAYAKHVVLRVDRADGFVARNFLTKSSTEHGIYIEEADGYLLDKVKMYWSGEYGNLSFTSDHGLYRRCDAYGAGDAAIYPGASPESGRGVEDRSFYPNAPRINTVVRHCDLRSSALGYSGSQGNAVRITRSDIYANTTGIVTDSISASGHPGYPPDSNVIDHNNIYANNLDSYGTDPPFVNTVGLPIGVGIMWPGVNMSTVRSNHIFDNWRRGTMLVSIPSGFERGTPEDPSAAGTCPPGGTEGYPTSCKNVYLDNVMGRAPKGFKPSIAVHKFGNPASFGDPGERNGVDFWWDEAPTVGNCWRDNVGPDGARSSLTSDPPIGPEPGKNVVGFLPEACDPDDPTYDLGIGGPGYGSKLAMLAICAQGLPGCEWFESPAEPGTAAARRQRRSNERTARRFLRSDEGEKIVARFHSLGTSAATGRKR